MVGRRKKHSEQALDERIEQEAEQEEERGILEVFPRDELPGTAATTTRSSTVPPRS